MYLDIDSKELVTTYPETIPSASQSMQQFIANLDIRVQSIVSSESRQRLEVLNTLLTKLLWAQLQSMGALDTKTTTKAEIMAQALLPARYERWLDESLAVLTHAGYLMAEGNVYTVLDATPLDRDALWKEWERSKTDLLNDPNMQAQIVLVEATLRVLPAILTGKMPATEVLFPNSSMHLVEGVYKNNAVSDYFNGVLADSVVAYVQERLQRDPTAHLRILEIGAGTGGTSAMVFRKLQPYQHVIAEYCYTDLSRAFLVHAEQAYGAQNPYLTYQLFNVEEPVAAQGIAAGVYDLVIATNVLHATRNIRQTLRNAKALVQKRGLLLLNEMSRNALFAHLTFGLLEGWWLYEDGHLRMEGCPGLAPERWQRVLESEGFAPILFPVREAHTLGQQLIVAESDGVVRQKQPPHTENSPEATPAQLSPERLTVPHLEPKPVVSGQTAIASVGYSQEALREKSVAYLNRLVSEALRVPAQLIDASAPLEKYGIDSIMVVQLTNALRKDFATVSSTLFFEYQTINDLADHFLQTQRETLVKLVGWQEQAVAAPDMQPAQKKQEPSTSHPPLKAGRRLFQHQALEKKPESTPSLRQDIAIVGLAGRYPQADTLQTFWINLKEGRNCISEIPKERWDWKTYFDAEKGKWGSMYSRWGGFLSEIDTFDPLFFQISPKEAEQMDPQERLFLQCAYASIEDAGYTPATLAPDQKVGVFVGVMNGHYTLGARYWSIANRLSYLLNLQGPSLAVDTACSSSLTAIHLALESLYSGTSDCAIAGGVNLIVDPIHYIKLSAATALSEGEQCRSFGEQADGFVDGEAVGALVLKPLERALAAGDHIYGVIKGSMLNAGGKTNGYTVPNPIAQARLIADAFQRSGVHPRTISYIEAHGTGTALGDPIEIAALTRAFEQQTQERGYCAIGSAKSNVGHCESAAGIVGITKVLLQLQHGQLAPSLHAERPNPQIEFARTPFVLQQELGAWKRPIVELEGERREYPRRAGISSFGAGGANAHVIIEEYIPVASEPAATGVPEQLPALIVLSAKNEERLRAQVEQLLQALQERSWTAADLVAVAYTLQVGREAMEARVGMIVRSLPELQEKLQGFLQGRELIEDVYHGQVKRNEVLSAFALDEELLGAIDRWLQSGKYGKLLDLWVKGLAFHWDKLYGEMKPPRISLPTYPFAREHYWISNQASNLSAGGVSQLAVIAPLHPLVQHNTSDLWEQRFSTILTGEEFFLADHVVMGQRLLPGAATLEMACVAIELAADMAHDDERRKIVLQNVVWVRPIIVGGEPLQVYTALEVQNENEDEIAFEIYSAAAENEGASIVHCQGSIVLRPATPAQTLELDALQEHCRQRQLSASECYSTFATLGMKYGPAFQALEHIAIGDGQVLAKLSLPESLLATFDQYRLHPSLVDAVLQASLGLMGPEREGTQPALPFALDELEVLGACTPQMWAWLRYNEGGDAGENVRKLNIDVCDEQGRICLRLKGFTVRVLEGDRTTVLPTSVYSTQMYYPLWKEQHATPQTEAPGYVEHIVVLCEPAHGIAEKLQKRLVGSRLISLHTPQGDIAQRYAASVRQVFELIQELFRKKLKHPVVLQLVVFKREERQFYMGLSGLLKTAHLENPLFLGRLLEVATEEDIEGIAAQLRTYDPKNLAPQIRYQDGKRYVPEWRALEVIQERVALPWKDAGIYLITGGAGALGLIFAREIAQTVQHATLILTGRAVLIREKQRQLDEIKALGAQVVYRQVDVSDRDEVEALCTFIRHEYGNIHGILHSAGVIRDNFLLKKSNAELQEVLDPKVAGVVYLDEVTQNFPLDFFILFSSASGVLGNTGQADYAAANAFMDAYAEYRNRLVETHQRQGRTLSLNWPLWQEGGMQLEAETARLLQRDLGLHALSTRNGLQAFYQAWAAEKDQVLVMVGQRKQLDAVLQRQQVMLTQPASSPQEKAGETVIVQDELREKTTTYLKKQLSLALNLPVQRIEVDAPLEKYGIDSILILQLTNRLEEAFGSLSKTLFFEYRTLQELSEYFVATYRDQLVTLLNVEEKAVMTPRSASPTRPDPERNSSVHRGRKRSRFAEPRRAFESAKTEHYDIAIVGVAGRYPQARNLSEYWHNLRAGKDCVTEIPSERWDHSQYFDPEKKPGKTYSRWGGFLDEVDCFDPLFFNISPREAEIMDPQERLFLECVFETLEDAGYTRAGLTGNVGVYVGVMYEEYQLYGAQETLQGRPVALAGNPSSIANRVSYFCNFHGPSLALDSMCSSSLTAIHLACQSILRGECQAAIAGGVNVSVHPNKYLMLAQGGFASSKGRCESFGQGGDGYVPAEGVGALLLKPLAQAKADGDHIYGIIKGSAINHGGKTNGYSVPNPTAQAQVIKQALQEAGVDARTISYIEAHGTGTALGDPIEITGLSKGFEVDPQERGYCAIGSAKSNIGHAESAAGIAGLTKVLLQLKHGQLAPSLHAEQLNPYIDFARTPFVVQRELEEWKRPVLECNGGQREYPRRAGISSFGAGGSNAHVVLEEYVAEEVGPEDEAGMRQEPVMIVLSARQEEQLYERVRRLLNALEEETWTEHDLGRIAYTLQVGREAMEERLALVVNSLPELKEKLRAFVSGQEAIEDLYRGQIRQEKSMLHLFTNDDEFLEIVDKWLQRGKYSKIAELWVKGLDFDWYKLYRQTKLRRISLPTYPFARERYWVPTIPVGTANRLPLSSEVAGSLHPLVQRNTSDLWTHRYSTTLTGREFFLTDHVVRGQHLLPGVAILEMARAASELAVSSLQEEAGTPMLKEVTWLRPVIVGVQPVQLHITLTVQDTGEILFAVSSEPGGGEVVLHSQGRIALLTERSEIILPITSLQASCQQHSLSARECYDAFRVQGLAYGPALQVLEHIALGDGQALALLVIPSHIAETLEDYVLHPSLLDGALQASIGLLAQNSASRPSVPFALEEVEILERCTARMWAWLRYSEGSQVGGNVQKLDIDLCTEQGQLCVRLKGFTSRILDTIPAALGQPDVADSLVGTVLLTPTWEVLPVVQGPITPRAEEVVLLMGGMLEQRMQIQQQYPRAHILSPMAQEPIPQLVERLEKLHAIEHIVWVPPYQEITTLDEEALITGQEQGVLALFRLVKALLLLGYGSKNLAWSIFTTQAQAMQPQEQINPLHASVHGLVGVLAKEYPAWSVRLVDLPLTEVWPLAELFTLPADPLGDAWAYRHHEWYRQKLLPVQQPLVGQTRYPTGGVYVVIGGAGGIGEAWSASIIQTYQAQIIWLGRRPLNETIRAKIERLAQLGPAPHYIAADATDRASLQRAYAEIKGRYGQIHGVIHAAIVLLDQSLVNMDEARFRAGLAAKVDVSVRLAQTFGQEALDFVLFFSSMNAFFKSPGQSNYAAGCVFEDAFAHQLRQTWSCAVKVMNWGYWGSVGAVSSPAYQERMAQAGVGSIELPEAMQALETLLAGPIEQMALLKTTSALLLKERSAAEVMTLYPEQARSVMRVLKPHIQTFLQAPQISPASGAERALENIHDALIETVSRLLKVSSQEIDGDAELNEYGLDPIKQSELIDRLNHTYNLELASTALLDHPTLNSLATYLVEKHKDVVITSDAGRTGSLHKSQEVFTETHTLQQNFSEESFQQMERLDTILKQLLWVQLRSLGLFHTNSMTRQELLACGPISERYKRWLDESLAVLTRAGYLIVDGDMYTLLDAVPIDRNAIWMEWERSKAGWLDDPNMQAQVVLVETTLRALPEILTGKVPATDILFPHSSVRLVEGIYKENQIVDYFNAALADIVVAYVQERLKQDATTPLRILEVGAGTGGTSAVILRKLQPYQSHIGEYCYTDLSRAFLLHAEKTYAPQAPYLTWQVLNIEEPLAHQEVASGIYDLVIAANVLHATRNIRQTLRNAKALLQKHGLLLLNEMSRNTLFTHLTFGLLEGWWLYEDAGLRMEGCPGLAPERWQAVLESEGFGSILFPVRAAHALGQQLIVAESDGIVRQKRHRQVEKRLQAMLAQQPSRSQVQPPQAVQKKPASKAEAGVYPQETLREKSIAYLKRLISEALKIPFHKIDAGAPLETYGIDSIMVVQLTDVLRKDFADVSSTLFFEYQTIEALVEHFLQTQREVFVRLVGVGEPQHEVVAVSPARTISLPTSKRVGLLLQRPEEMRKDTTSMSFRTQDIAIIGLAGRYPQADTLQAFWTNLKEGRNCISEIPKERWDWKTYFDAEKGKWGSMYSRWGGFLSNIDTFDPLFFQIAPREAEQMDPQERLFLQCAYASIEDAGYTPATLAPDQKVGVFVGVMNGNYASGARYWSIANRLSYLLNLQGPSLAVDTACSSSLTAIHLALESLYSGTSDCAIAGGVNLIVDPIHYMRLSMATMLSEGDQCRSFGEQADGFVDGEAVGALVLKPLERALAAGDHIYGVIKGSMLNAGGKTNGYTVPNPIAQARVIADALQRSGVHPRTISYIEAHGTGTALGDPIEIAALTRAFEQQTQEHGYCAIGSAKSNVGHCESAAGIVGITKVLLQLQHGQLAPSLHAERPNPQIAFGRTPFVLQQELGEWKRPIVELEGERREYPRRAGISSFGAGGANAHVIIEEYVPVASAPAAEGVPEQLPALIVLSAKNEERLRAQVEQLLQALQERSWNAADLTAIAYTLQVGREAMEARVGMIVRSLPELQEKLQAFLQGRSDGIEDLYRDEVGRNKETIALFADENSWQIIGGWMARHEYARLVALWVKGLVFDWNKLYGETKPQRISLPTYPFAQIHYWLSPAPERDDTVSATATRAVRDYPEHIPSLMGAVDEENVAVTDGAIGSNEIAQRNGQTPVAIQQGTQSNGHHDPEKELERKVAAIWEEVLGVEQVDIHSNFQDLGGDSIMATQVISRLKKNFPFDLQLDALFGVPTVAAMAAIVEEALIEKIEELPEDVIVQLLA